MAKSGTNLGPVDLSSDIPPVEASSGQEQYYSGQLDIFDQPLGKLTFGQMYPLVVASNGQEWY